MRAFSFTVLIFFILQTAWCQEFAAGKETAYPSPDTVNKEIRIYLPENYSEDQKWPVIFYYHGMNGKPGTGLFQKYTEKKDFIIVSMDYFFKGTKRFNSEKESFDYYQKEFKNLVQFKEILQKKISLDPGKVYIAGVSKGGWTTAMICETHLSEFAGAVIFLAGRMRSQNKKLKKAGRTDIPMYVGVGEFDGNLIPGVAAIDHFKKLGASVNFEMFDGIGHSMPDQAPTVFKEWLNLQRPDFKIDLDNWFEKKLKGLNGDDPKTLFASYLEVRESPLLQKLSNSQKNKYSQLLNSKAKEIPQLTKEIKAYTEFYKIMNRETDAGVIKDWEKAISNYQALQEKYKGTEYAAKCQAQIDRAAKTLENAKAYFEKIKNMRK